MLNHYKNRMTKRQFVSVALMALWLATSLPHLLTLEHLNYAGVSERGENDHSDIVGMLEIPTWLFQSPGCLVAYTFGFSNTESGFVSLLVLTVTNAAAYVLLALLFAPVYVKTVRAIGPTGGLVRLFRRASLLICALLLLLNVALTVRLWVSGVYNGDSHAWPAFSLLSVVIGVAACLSCFIVRHPSHSCDPPPSSGG